MPGPGSGTACTLVAPSAPNSPHEADNANPGAVSEMKAEQAKTQTGKYGSVPAKPFKADDSDADPDKPKHWIEIQLLDETDQPVAGEPYKITLPDSSVSEGTTDDKGLARVDGIPDAGSCQITFPKRDTEAWTAL